MLVPSMSRVRWLLASGLLAACGVPEEPAPDVIACAAGLYTSASGCHGRYCRACASVSECEPIEACTGGTCGACREDDECAEGRSCRSGFCVETVLPAWNLEVAEADLALIVADPYRELFIPCALTAAGVRYQEGCRVRLRGGTSRDYPKKSFRITFPEDTPHPGFSRKINLRAEYNDHTYLRSLAAYEAFARFTRIPISRHRFIQLAINGEPYGLMLEIERVGSAFLRENDREETALYEADPPNDLFAMGGGSLISLPDETTYRSVYQKPVGPTFDDADLMGMIGELESDYRDGGASTAVRSLFRVSDLLDYLAVMAVIQNLDHVRKNYYLSPQSDGWEIYPWDLDLTYGCLYDEEAGDTICDSFTADAPADPGVLGPGVEPTFPLEGHYNLLIHQTLSDPELRSGFECRACAMIDSPFWSDHLTALLDATAGALEPAVEADARDLDASIEDWRARVDELELFPALRAEHLRAALGCP